MNRGHKGQAALEFLSTYGFAFLIILVMIGALSYFGVLNPKNLIPNRCMMSAEFQCFETRFISDVGAGTMTLNVVIINQVGNSLALSNGLATSQFGNSEACTFTPPTGVIGGMKATISCLFPNRGTTYPAVGEKMKASLGFQYLELGKEYPVTVNSEVLQTLQAPTP